jgi:uncharacterized protein (TIGR01777 family)
MRVVVTGATGLIGPRLVAALLRRGDEVVVLSRDAARAGASLGVDAMHWDPLAQPAPSAALRGADAVVHLAGAPVAQRWTTAARRAIAESRELGTRNLVAGMTGADSASSVLVTASGVGYYGDRGDELLDDTRDPGPGDDFLSKVCVTWEREALGAEQIGARVVALRTGVVLDRDGGALAKMLPFFSLGIGGPVAGGRQRIPWIHRDDLVGLYLRALDDAGWSGAFNATAPDPPTNAQFSKALGRALRRPALLSVPGLALRILYGQMSMIVTSSQRAIPSRALEQGFTFAHPDLEPALRDVLSR